MKIIKPKKWILAAIRQVIFTFLAAGLAAILPLLFDADINYVMTIVIQMILYPLFGATFAFLATRKGLLSYVAWVVPPIMLVIAEPLFVGFPADALAVLISAVVAVVGSAAGDVYIKFYGEN